MGEPSLGRGNFFRGWVLEHEDFLYNGGGTLPGLGEPSSRLDSHTLNKSVLTVGEPGSGELFSGLDLDTLSKSVLTVGEPGLERGIFFSHTQLSNTNEG